MLWFLAPCEGIDCGRHAYCKPEGLEAHCICEDGWSFDPLDISAGCKDIDECDKALGPSGQCARGATCTNLEGKYNCECPPGFAGNAFKKCLGMLACVILSVRLVRFSKFRIILIT